MIWFLGDVHGRFDHLVEAVATRRPEAVIFLGDLDCTRPLDQEVAELLGLTEVWFIPGNHDTDSESSWNHLNCERLRHRNLHGRVATIDGRRVAGLGGVFRSKVWYPPEAPSHESHAEWMRSVLHPAGRNLSTFKQAAAKARAIGAAQARTHLSTIFPETYDRLARQRADIVVTHEAPGCHPMGFPVLDELVRRMGAGLIVHGHHHDNPDYRPFEETAGFRMLGVGLRGITDENGERIVPGELDDRWRGDPSRPRGDGA